MLLGSPTLGLPLSVGFVVTMSPPPLGGSGGFCSAQRQIFLQTGGRSRGATDGSSPKFHNLEPVFGGNGLGLFQVASASGAPSENRRNDQGRPRGAPSPAQATGALCIMRKEDGR